MDGYLLDTNHLVPLLRDGHQYRAEVLKQLATSAADAPVYVAAATLAELEVGCCFPHKNKDRSDAQSEIREVIRANRLSIIDFTKHTAAEYGALKAGLMQKYNRDGLKKKRAKWPEAWIDPDTGRTLDVDEFDLLAISHAIERRLVLVTSDSMRRILDGIEIPADCPGFVNWIPTDQE